MKTIPSILAIVVTFNSGLLAQHPSMPAGMSHEEHLRQLQKDDALKHRGALAMGFDQDQTAHHFLLRPSGGAIVVAALNRNDAETVNQIRTHLAEIATSFGEGLFEKPVATHGELPPGAAVMTANKQLIRYQYRERPDGGEVAIETADADTLKGIHEFLRYQIVEHKTGDPLTPAP